MSFDQVAARAAADLRQSVGVVEDGSLELLRRTRRRRAAISTSVMSALALLVAVGWILVLRPPDEPPPANRPVRNGAVVGLDEGVVYAVDGELGSGPPSAAGESSLQFISDGHELVYSNPKGQVVARDVRTGEERVLTRCPVRAYCRAAVSPDGATVAVPSSRGTVWVDVATGTRTLFTASPAGAMTWSPDGTHVAVMASRGLWVVDTETLQARRIVAFARKAPYDVRAAWSPDGKRIAYVAQRPAGMEQGLKRTAFTLLVIDPDGSHQKRVLGLGTCTCWVRVSPPDVAWSPDGTRFAVTGGGLGAAYSFRIDGSDRQYIGTAATQLAWQPVR